MTMDLFDQRREQLLKKNAPLADRMRPRTLDEFFGQGHIIGPGRLLRRAIQIDQLSSVIFYGPPGTGKTTLARIIANTTKAHFISINAVLAGIKEIREAIEEAQKQLSLFGRRTILFIDEVHRFNKSQQDALLPHVENGVIILIGATTENPYFEVNKALVSRSRIFQLKTLTIEDLKDIARFALTDKERGYGNLSVHVDDDALNHLIQVANGDARGVLNALELAVETTKPGPDGALRIDRAIAEDSIQQRAVLYDKDGDAHYDTISAFIKSVRGSDPDAALYWMSKMIYAGEDPRFIFRRMLILACEDVGLADPKALGIVVDAARAFDYVGLPEGRYHLAHACLYLSTAAKSNSSMAFFDALKVVSQEAKDDVPNHLRDASRDREGFGHGEGYLYPHAYRDHWVAQQYLPSALQGKFFYQPSDQGYEKSILERVARIREAQVEAMVDQESIDPFDMLGMTPQAQEKSGREVWAKRTGSQHGSQLASLRDTLLTLADIKPDDLVLDLHARSGLLSNEASRLTKEGGVWTLAFDDREYETLVKNAPIDALVRPQIILTTPEKFDKDLRAAAGEGVGFSVIVGRNILTHCDDKSALIEKAAGLLEKKGRIVLAEVVPKHGQRLSELLHFKQNDTAIETLFQSVEEELFRDSSDPMLNWDEESLKRDLEKIGLTVRILIAKNSPMTRVLPSNVDFWFRRSLDKNRKSLGDRLAAKFNEEDLERLKSLFHEQLDNKEVQWKTSMAYFKITRE
jgi:putative ATPase